MTDTIYSACNGVRRRTIIDSENPYKVVVRTEQDIEPILDSVARDRDIMKNNGDFKVVARAPIEVYERSIHEQWDEGDWKKWLDDPANRPFRIWQGRV